VFARVSHARYPPEHFDAGLRVVLDDLLPALRRAPGFRGCMLFANGRPGTALAVVLWDTEEAADSAAVDERVAAAHVKLGGLGLAIDARQIYDVVHHEAVHPP
jgi:hypothetical protein